ncbi:MAG: hypothetical protein E7096_08415 [Bacteroides sp.]|nr:hypothetical protein [Bacteroides sp.]
MKTNKLMTAFALSAMFAACTQDAELNETLAKNDFSNVPMVEADFTVNTGVDSRMATKYGWELDDIVGFVWDGTGTDGKAYANNPLYCTNVANTAFEGQSMYYVGNYFAYIPYADALKGVDFVPFSIKGQALTTSLADLAKHSIMISPSQTELVVLGEDDELADGQQEAGRKKNYPLYLSQLSNTAKIVLNFENAEALTDLKVTKVTLDLIGGNSTTSILPLNFNFDATGYDDVEVEEWDEATPAEFYDNFVAADTRTVGPLALESEEGLSVANNTLTTYAIVLPHKASIVDKLNVTVETNYGTIVADGVKVIAKGKTEADAKAVSATTELFAKFGTTGTIVAELDADDIQVGAQTVATQAELNDVLNMLVTSGYENDVEITVKPATKNTDGNFVFTNFTLPEGLKAKVELIAETTKAPNGFVFEGNTVINKQILLSGKVLVKGTMTVEYLEDANESPLTTLEAANPVIVDNAAVLVNNGVISASIRTSAATTTPVAKVAGKYISNSEDANFVGGQINNLGEVQWIAGTLPTFNPLSTGAVYAEVNNFKEMLAADNAGVTTVRFINNVVFDNYYDDVEINSSIKTIEVYGSVSMNVNKKSLDGSAVQVQLGNVVNILVKEGATFAILSNLKENQVVLGTNCKITTEKNSNLSLNKIVMAYLGSIEYAGRVTVDTSNLDTATLVQKEGGVYTAM